MKEDERCGACGTNGAESEMHPRFWWETWGKERWHRLGNDNKMELKEVECEGVDGIDLAENRDRLL
jgi:hypothetical protein